MIHGVVTAKKTLKESRSEKVTLVKGGIYSLRWAMCG
jgi:hypothetical protein